MGYTIEVNYYNSFVLRKLVRKTDSITTYDDAGRYAG